MTKTVFHSGKIVDQQGQPLIGAHIVLASDVTKGTITDFDGNFQVQGNEGDIYKIGHLGKFSQTIKLYPGMFSSTYILKDDVTQLDEVVVVGQKKKTNYTIPVIIGLAAVLVAYNELSN